VPKSGVDTKPGPTPGGTVGELVAGYRAGELRPSDVVSATLDRIGARGNDGTWISVADRDELAVRAKELEQLVDPASAPLYGVPFGVKDSIDVAGVLTTLACPDYAYRATATAPVVERLIAAGGIYVGKTNLDQFATGLNGTRTPYPIPRSVYGGNLISGGSSSGSALAVATGDVPFAVATDTAGSGRVPPALNGIVGFKPSRGLVSTVGLVPACRSLDCISLIAGGVADLATVFDVVAAHDRRDPYARPRRREFVDPLSLRVGMPAMTELEFFGDQPMQQAHDAARSRVERSFARTVEVPFGLFLAAGELLYQGPWVAERLTEFGDFLADHPESVLPVIRDILGGATAYTAVDVFAAEHRLGELRAEVAGLWQDMDLLVLPAIGTTFTTDEVLADPIATNTALGHYTHFGNLLDLCAAVVPAGLTSDGRPASLMVLGPALADDRVLGLAAVLADANAAPAHITWPAPRSEPRTTLVVVGHHLAGQPRNGDIVDRGGYLLDRTTTSPDYRLVVVGAEVPLPALVRVPSSGAAVEVESWSVPSHCVPDILANSSPSICLGQVTLADRSVQLGFVAGASVASDPDATDITSHGGWRRYLASVAAGR
jgi:allophanate hydrolase